MKPNRPSTVARPSSQAWPRSPAAKLATRPSAQLLWPAIFFSSRVERPGPQGLSLFLPQKAGPRHLLAWPSFLSCMQHAPRPWPSFLSCYSSSPRVEPFLPHVVHTQGLLLRSFPAYHVHVLLALSFQVNFASNQPTLLGSWHFEQVRDLFYGQNKLWLEQNAWTSLI